VSEHSILVPVQSGTVIQDKLKYRLALVSELRLAGKSKLQISQILATEHGIVNERSGEPLSAATIGGDLRKLRQQWKDDAMVSTSAHLDRQYMELQEIKKVAKIVGELAVWLNALKEEIKLLGTSRDKLTVRHVDWRDEAADILRDGTITYDDMIIYGFDKELAVELLKRAGRIVEVAAYKEQ